MWNPQHFLDLFSSFLFSKLEKPFPIPFILTATCSISVHASLLLVNPSPFATTTPSPGKTLSYILQIFCYVSTSNLLSFALSEFLLLSPPFWKLSSSLLRSFRVYFWRHTSRSTFTCSAGTGDPLTGNEGTVKLKTCFDPELRLRLGSCTTIFSACLHFFQIYIFNLFLNGPSTETVLLYVISTTTTYMHFNGLMFM